MEAEAVELAARQALLEYVWAQRYAHAWADGQPEGMDEKKELLSDILRSTENGKTTYGMRLHQRNGITEKKKSQNVGLASLGVLTEKV